MIPQVATIEDVRRQVDAARAGGLRVGLVPTMGALHEGHVRLVERCRAECGFVVVSIFVNPTQFGPSEDFTRYPRSLDRDRELAAGAGCDLVFAPGVATIYPRGEDAFHLEHPTLFGRLEGASRPGHFRGVATVVLKLFEIVGPDLAFFGQKDYQQQVVIRRMVEDLNLRVAVRVVPTVREPDGLALSSRNVYLNPDQRQAAASLSRALELAQAAVGSGVRDPERVRQILRETIESEALAELDYAEVVDAETLESMSELAPGRRAVALLAVRFGSTRLIDNALLPE
jgi:pantoate--beta-alanine ligase